jgi:hypothetical protein
VVPNLVVGGVQGREHPEQRARGQSRRKMLPCFMNSARIIGFMKKMPPMSISYYELSHRVNDP